MKKSHNKKRNVGIIYEQLIKTISRSLVTNDINTAKIAKLLVKKYFKQGTELYKEHKLFQALVTSQITDSSLATSILQEAKKAARSHNVYQLDREKSRLIRDINLKFSKKFYNQKIKEYKNYATVQTLLNNWRSKSTLDQIVLYEGKVHKILITEKHKKTLEEEKDPNINQLVMNLLIEKFNKKYGSRFDDTQKNLIKQYVFSDKKPEAFKTTLQNLKESTVSELLHFSAKCDSNIVLEKINPVIKEIKEISILNINDETIGKFLTVCQLRKELVEKYDE